MARNERRAELPGSCQYHGEPASTGCLQFCRRIHARILFGSALSWAASSGTDETVVVMYAPYPLLGASPARRD